MNTLNIGKRSSVVRTVMVVVVMALLGAMLVTTVAAAPEDTGEAIDIGVLAAESECKLFGGQGSTHYEFNVDGGVDMATTTCVGGGLDGRVCTTTPTAQSCGTPGKFVQPTQQVVPEQRPDTAAPVENPQQTFPIVGDIAAPPGGVAEDPTGDEEARIAEDEANEQAAACKNAGGTGTVIDNRSTATIDVRCAGGVLDGMVCRNGHYETVCDVYRGPTGPENPTTIATGDIEFVQVESMPELEEALLGAAEDPTGADTVVVYNQVAYDASEAATDQVLACEALGGTATVEQFRTVASGLMGVHVGCKGGLLDGLKCANSTRVGTACGFYRSVVPDDPRVTPVAGVEVPAESITTATAVVTVTPTPAMDDDVGMPPDATATAPPPPPTRTLTPVEPTVAPTAAPPPPPRNDNSVPPGESIEPGEPTPTPVVLT